MSPARSRLGTDRRQPGPHLSSASSNLLSIIVDSFIDSLPPLALIDPQRLYDGQDAEVSERMQHM